MNTNLEIKGYKEILETIASNVKGTKPRTYNLDTNESYPGKNVVIISGGQAYMIINSGDIVRIDADDVDRVQKHRWWTAGPGYVATEIKGVNLYLHRFIMNPPSNKVVDHKHHNKHDNRKSRLRVLTPVKNHWNRKNRNGRYVGVTVRDRVNKRFLATLRVSGVTVLYKSFEHLVDARIARLEAELEYRGQYNEGMREELEYLYQNRESLLEDDEDYINMIESQKAQEFRRYWESMTGQRLGV